MESILEDNDNFSSSNTRFYENNFKYTKDGKYDDWEFDDQSAYLKRKK